MSSLEVDSGYTEVTELLFLQLEHSFIAYLYSLYIKIVGVGAFLHIYMHTLICAIN